MVERDDVDWAMLADLPPGGRAGGLPSTASEEYETERRQRLCMRGSWVRDRMMLPEPAETSAMEAALPAAPPCIEKTPEPFGDTAAESKADSAEVVEDLEDVEDVEDAGGIRRPRGRRRWSPTTLRPMEILLRKLLPWSSLSCARLRMFSRVGMCPRRRRWP